MTIGEEWQCKLERVTGFTHVCYRWFLTAELHQLKNDDNEERELWASRVWPAGVFAVRVYYWTERQGGERTPLILLVNHCFKFRLSIFHSCGTFLYCLQQVGAVDSVYLLLLNTWYYLWYIKRLVFVFCFCYFCTLKGEFPLSILISDLKWLYG